MKSPTNRRRAGAFAAGIGLLTFVGQFGLATAATAQNRYYAHDAIEDEHGVIAPWYDGQNGLVDYRVRVAAEPPGQVTVEVADDGVGMPPEVLLRAAEAFFTTKPSGRGTGLAL